MPEYTIQTGEMNRIMELLFHVLNLRITFFDLREEEVDSFTIKEMSPFCRSRRQDPDFNARCIECDRTHLAEAKRRRDIHIYRCHAGLLEGIVPLTNRSGIYLGAIVFGQLADRESPVAGVRVSSVEKMLDIGRLLKYLSEYICENELIRRSSRHWTLQLEEYVAEHLDEPLTLGKIAARLGRSVSFLSHNIPVEFGVPFKAWLRERKMARAREMLAAGAGVAECAFELGYYDAFYFSREFKRFHGIAPREWRRAAAGDGELPAKGEIPGCRVPPPAVLRAPGTVPQAAGRKA